MALDSAASSHPDDAALDNPVWAALTGPHQRFARAAGRAARYPADMSPFAALADAADPAAWSDLESLVGADAVAIVAVGELPPGWREIRRLSGFQMVETSRFESGPPDDALVRLGTDDAAAMLDLVRRTDPGPFAQRTIEMGAYFGVRDASGALVAMAGERMATGSWREVSAVATDPDHRGHGYARRLVHGVVEDIRGRGERAFLHVLGANPAKQLYEAWGFEVRRPIDIVVTSRG